MAELQLLLEAEKTHFQFTKQATNFSVFIILTLVNIWRGSKSSPSIFGVETCSALDWGSLAVFMAYCVCITALSLKKMQHE